MYRTRPAGAKPNSRCILAIRQLLNRWPEEELIEMFKLLRVALVIGLSLSVPLFAGERRERGKPDEPEILAKGFKVQYFATPPEIEYPACVAVSPSGTVFVGIDPYNVRANKSKTGKIKMFVDTNG